MGIVGIVACLVSRSAPYCIMMTSTQQSVVQPGQPLFTKSTKFNDLPDNVKKTFEDIEYVRYRCYFADT